MLLAPILAANDSPPRRAPPGIPTWSPSPLPVLPHLAAFLPEMPKPLRKPSLVPRKRSPLSAYRHKVRHATRSPGKQMSSAEARKRVRQLLGINA